MVMDGHRIACLGDVVRYPDGTESTIVSGAGAALALAGTYYTAKLASGERVYARLTMQARRSASIRPARIR